ncbi:type II toxin-antitoxin system Phd/YefM family antitoxin [Streptomyces sp. Inha503]|uniref:type II toxin-antitoxin system Phd/YefM family antitoxin n=1 Tax=Streptomyces sp. Inha503 TaxID=3383314 RepID=UPI0039A25162
MAGQRYAAGRGAGKGTLDVDTEARARFGSLMRGASHARERTTITDHGQPAAVLINPQELADLEDALAVAQYRARQASGETTGVPHEQVRAQLGLGHVS